MKRLPSDRMLNYAIENNSIKENEITNFTNVLINYYISAVKIEISADAYCSKFKNGILNNCEELIPSKFKLSKNLINSITIAQLNFLDNYSKHLSQRAINNKIIDAHGDLRPEHICLLEKPVIIDCLEFSSELRVLDPVDELAFLALECERLGSSFVAKRILEIYFHKTNDYPSLRLIYFYKIYRACVRAKLAIWHLKDSQNLDNSKWIERTNEYLNLAKKYIYHLNLTNHT